MQDTCCYVLTDVEQALWTESWVLNEETRPLGAGQTWSVEKRSLKGGLQDGVDVIEVDNGALSIFIVPTRGMGIWKGIYRGIPLGWESPVRNLVNPAFIDLNDRGGLGWLKGFNEWIVRCGLDSNGAPCTDTIIDNNGNKADVFLPLHGKIANIPARYVEVRVDLSPPHRITVLGTVEEAMVFGPALRLTTAISTQLGSGTFTISDRITNLNRRPTELELLYHCNYGAPSLRGRCYAGCPVQNRLSQRPPGAGRHPRPQSVCRPRTGLCRTGLLLRTDRQTGQPGNRRTVQKPRRQPRVVPPLLAETDALLHPLEKHHRPQKTATSPDWNRPQTTPTPKGSNEKKAGWSSLKAERPARST